MDLMEKFRQKQLTVSFEVFPPKNDAAYAPVEAAVDALAAFSPDFISVTYGAGGGTSVNTPKIAAHIENDLHIPAMAHLTCASSDKQTVRNVLTDLKARGVRNLLALRGDLPEGYVPDDAHYRYAAELVAAAKAMGGFTVGAACYPEGHVESESPEKDLEYLKQKVDCGADFLVTQMFFDNSVLYSFLYRALKKGIDVPVCAGIMPVMNSRQIARSCKLSGTTLPARLKTVVDRFADDPQSLMQAGIAYATEQIVELVANGVGGIHIYTMNRPEVAGAIMRNLSSIL
ncbi:MAG TPA: methylenetetrahydrofolate reductase [NAD(P)H] [Candidatus Fimenecus excrementigallinarum]|uniref:Methylenetetrahydrofolate reductase n=1 Tax=Candidatus Fimenecus excrementigallinarum TaxID=2840816 RepID=A0A9D1IE79_9FIRM|nr:methylenetetrahydrofolate reductase [NAD(P)H] [Candidatus Fimenecus excrementigallinarum]